MADHSTTTRILVGDRDAVKLALRSVRLTVVAGPDAGRSACFTDPLVRIGAATDNDFRLDDRRVSGFHATLRMLTGGRFELEDLRSTNGTFVGGARVPICQLDPGVTFRVGESDIRIEDEVSETVSLLGEGRGLEGMLGATPGMRDLFGLLQAAAPTRAGVLITGETGTGKERVARSLHQLSGLRGPLVVFDAATSQPDLIQSKLFGHVKGAFTGAERDRPGAFRAAKGGTLFLDEIGELPLEVQPNLLRVLESREVVPVGADHPVPVDARVVAATHRDLAAMVEAGDFRQDLYHRLAIVRLEVPPLRHRLEDLELLIPHFLGQLEVDLTLDASAREALARHPWPGNLRELKNTLEALSIRCRGRVATAADLDLAPAAVPGEAECPTTETMAGLEREAIQRALERCGGNRSRAARELGISRVTLWRRLKDWGLD